MKFEEKYPDAEYLQVYGEDMLKDKEQLPCWICKTPTSFVEMNYQAYICSEECVKVADQEAAKFSECFGRYPFDCELGTRCLRYRSCEEEWASLEDYEDEFEPGRVNVNMFGLNP